MRTFRVELRAQVDATKSVIVSTEVMVGDDAEVHAAGSDARIAIDAFIAGYIEAEGC